MRVDVKAMTVVGRMLPLITLWHPVPANPCGSAAINEGRPAAHAPCTHMHARAPASPHRVAEPLHCRDTDSAVKGAGTCWETLPQVTQAQVSLHLTLHCNVQHGGADVHALQKNHAKHGYTSIVAHSRVLELTAVGHWGSRGATIGACATPLLPPVPRQRCHWTHHPGVPSLCEVIATEP